MRTRCFTCLTLLFVLPAVRARAGNADEILLGNDAAITAGAVVATINDGSALWYNPAGLALAAKDSVDVSASAFALRKYELPRQIVANGAASDASFTEIVTIPSALTYVRTLSPRITIGAGLFASQLHDATLRSWLAVDDAQGGTSLGFASAREVSRYHVGVGLGFALTPTLKLGVSLFGDYYGDSSSNQAYAGTKRDGRARVFDTSAGIEETTLYGLHASLGLHYTPTPMLSFGLSLTSPGMYFHRSQKRTGADSTLDLDQSRADFTPTGWERSGAKLGSAAPLRIRLGAALRLGRTLVSLEGDLQTPFEDDTLDLDQNLVWNVRAGARVFLTETLNLGGGLFTDRGYGRFLGGDRAQHFYGGTVGGEYTKVRRLSSNEGRDTLTFTTTVALRYARGSGDIEGFGFPPESGAPYLAELTVHELTLHIGSGLYF